MADVSTASFESLTIMSRSQPNASPISGPQCPRCGSKMRLVRIEPDPIPTRSSEQLMYSCECGETLVEAVERT